MDMFWTIDWRAMFIPTMSLIEVFLRGTLIYFGLLILLRLFKRP